MTRKNSDCSALVLTRTRVKSLPRNFTSAKIPKVSS